MPYGNMTGGEDFVLGQRSAFGKNIAKEFKGSDQSKRQAALSMFMFEQGAKQRKQEKALNEAFESGSKLNNLKGAPYVPKATGGIHKGAKQPTGGATISEMASMAKDNPTFFNTLLAGTLAQGPAKVIGRVAEAFTGDETTGNRFSKNVLDELTEPSNARFGMAKTGLVNMTADERRIAANKFYADQLKANEEMAFAKETLAPEFTSDATYGDFIDTASWFSPGSFLKGLKAAGKAGSVGAKAFGAAPRQARLAGGLAAGAGAYAAYNELKPEEAKAGWNLAKPASYAGKKMESVVGKPISEFTPDDIAGLLSTNVQAVLGRSDKAGFDTNYNRQRIIREAFNDMLNQTGQTGNKRGYSNWFKSLPKEEQEKILSEGRYIDDEVLSKLGMEALQQYTTVVNGERVWKEGGKEAMLGKHDLGHTTVGAERGTKEHDLFFQPSKSNKSAAAIFMRK